MDFASLMKAQISSASTTKSDTNENSKKFLRRSELETQRREAYLKSQEELENTRLNKVKQKRKREEEDAERQRDQKEKRARLAEESRRLREEEAAIEEAARRKRLGLPEALAAEEASGDDQEVADDKDDVEDSKLKARLQLLGEPRILFGESHRQRLRRWKMLNQAATSVQMSSGPIPTSLELLEEKDMKVPRSVPEEKEARLLLRRQLASYFDLVLSEWVSALARRPREVKDSVTGKQAYNSYIAAISNLKPLFQKLESNDIPNDILKPVVEIVDLAQRKRYVDANDAYLRLSIGNTAWPIGVTMVGIHERSAREKLHEDGNAAAHIMSDEVTRKMIQGIKRSLTFAQTRWPPDELGQLMG